MRYGIHKNPYYIILQPACTLRNIYEYYYPPSYTSSVPAYQLLLSVAILYLLASIIYLESKKADCKNGSKKLIYYQLFSYKLLYICLKWCTKRHQPIMTNALFIILYLVRFILLANFFFFSFLANRFIYPTTNLQYQ